MVYFIAKVGLGRNPAPQRAGAGSRPRQMALKWSKKGYIPFIASYNCLNWNVGRGRSQESCPGVTAKKPTEPTPGAAVSGGALQMFVAAGSRANWHRGGLLVSGILERFRVDDMDCMARKSCSSPEST